MNSRGFSVLEMLIALAIGVICLAAISEFFVQQVEVFASQEQVLKMQNNTRSGMELTVREIRMAGYDPTGDAGAGILSASASRFSFTMDLNGDGDVADTDETLTYALADVDNDGDQDLVRITGNNTQAVSHNVTGLVFSYTTRSGGVTSTPSDLSDVIRVQVGLIGHTEEAERRLSTTTGHRSWQLSTAASLRNMQIRQGTTKTSKESATEDSTDSTPTVGSGTPVNPVQTTRIEG